MTHFLDRLARFELLVVTGKGGVGKTAVSASLGQLLAANGRRVLVVEVDPRENVHQMLGVPPSGGAIVPAGERLFVQNLKPRQVVDEIVRERLKIGLLADRVLRSPVYDHFVGGAPGLSELAILGHALRLIRGLTPAAPALDLVILDAPATGHGVRLLAAPQLVAEVIETGPFGAMAGELAAWIADGERTGILAVTLAEEMPVDEVLELRQALAAQVGREVAGLVVNGVYPTLPEKDGGRDTDGSTDGGDGHGRRGAEADPLGELWRRRRWGQERELARLAALWPGPRLTLPQLALDRGPALSAALGLDLAREPEGAWS